MPRYSSLGLAFRRLRDERGITQTAMAAALGVSPSWLSRLESGREEMAESCLADATRFLGVEDDAADAIRAAWAESRLPIYGAAS